MAGRLNFVATCVMGPLGATCVNFIYRHALVSGPHARRLSPQAINELSWWLSELRDNKLVPIHVGPHVSAPTVIYTDAEGSGGTGGVVFRKGSCQWFRRHVREIDLQLSDRKTQIVAYELIAVLQALNVFKCHILARDVLLMVDNSTAVSCIKKGRSRCLDLNDIVRMILSTASRCHAKIHVRWVPSS